MTFKTKEIVFKGTLSLCLLFNSVLRLCLCLCLYVDAYVAHFAAFFCFDLVLMLASTENQAYMYASTL